MTDRNQFHQMATCPACGDRSYILCDVCEAPLTHRERGVVQRTIGGPANIEFLDDAEAAEYREGYDHAE